jgi:hypothetical protein
MDRIKILNFMMIKDSKEPSNYFRVIHKKRSTVIFTFK